MALISGLFHESEAKTRLAEERRDQKYGGDQKVDSMVDLSEESIPGVLMKKIVRPGNGELPPVGSNVSHWCFPLEDKASRTHVSNTVAGGSRGLIFGIRENMRCRLPKKVLLRTAGLVRAVRRYASQKRRSQMTLLLL